MRWKLTTLIENHVDKEERYMCEHGLAILIESENQEEQVCLLMDTGQSGIFYENAAKMGISLENLSALLNKDYMPIMWEKIFFRGNIMRKTMER